jgi:hypothetical protein
MGVKISANFGGKREAGGNWQTELDHPVQVGALAA